MDFSEMSKEELIEYIKSLDEQTNGKYGLVWDKEKEPEKIVVECDKKIPILKEIKKKAINNGGQNNILIEGDNFHALSVLNYTHKESIDVIYIDPPYNTGNNDFMYNDRFVDFEDGYRHSKWLNFMEKRLRLARELLNENGVIFISIDENEFAQLKLVCDNIFSENNLIAIFNWKKTSTPPSLSKNVRRKFEFLLCYQNVNYSNGLSGGTIEGGDMPLLNGSNAYTKAVFNKDAILFKLENGTYKAGQKDKVFLHNDVTIKNGKSTQDLILSGNFKWTQSTINEEIAQGTKFWIKSDKFSIRYQRDGKRIKVPSNIISKEECDVGTNEDATKELKRIFNSDNSFSYPKPVSLIKYLVNMVTYNKRNAIILDFFAGSGTTGQAVLELNAEDGGNRKFILCTNNENNICEDVTYPRIKTVITGKREDGSKYSDGLAGSLQYFKTDFVDNVGTKDQLYYDLTEKCIPMLCVKGDTFVPYKSTEEYSIYTNNEKTKYSCVYFDVLGQKYKEFLKEVKKIKESKLLYIFNLGDYIDLSDLKEIDNYSVESIPYKIIELYKKIVKMSKGE